MSVMNLLEQLDDPISNQEVQSVIKRMKGNKVSGMDGIPIELYE